MGNTVKENRANRGRLRFILGKCMSAASPLALAAASLCLVGGEALANEECGPASPIMPKVFCTAPSYGSLTYPQGGTIELANGAMIVGGDVTIDGRSSSLPAILIGASYSQINGDIVMNEDVGELDVRLQGGAVNGQIEANTTNGDIVVTLDGTTIKPIVPLQRSIDAKTQDGDITVLIDQNGGSQSEVFGEVTAVSTGDGDVSFQMGGGSVAAEGFAVYLASDIELQNNATGDVAFKMTGGTIIGGSSLDTDTIQLISDTGKVSITINEATGKTQIAGRLYAVGQFVSLDMSAGNLEATSLDGAQSLHANFSGGTITPKGASESAIGIDFTRSPDQNVTLSGATINLNEVNQIGVLARPATGNALLSYQMSAGTINLNAHGTRGFLYEGSEFAGASIVYVMSGGQIQGSAPGAGAAGFLASYNDAYDIRFDGGTVNLFNGSAVIVNSGDQTQPEYVSIKVNIGPNATVNTVDHLFLNTIDRSTSTVNLTVAGRAQGPVVLGGGDSSLTLSGGSLSSLISGDYDQRNGQPSDIVNQGADNFLWTGGSYNGSFWGQGGNDSVTLSGLDLRSQPQTLTMDGGESALDTRTNQDIDIFTLQSTQITALTTNGITRWERFIVDGSTIGLAPGQLVLDGYTSGNSNGMGDFIIRNGGFVVINEAFGKNNYALSGNLEIADSRSSFMVLKDGTAAIGGDLRNDGLLRMDDGMAGGRIIVQGNYPAAGGMLSVDTDFAKLVSDTLSIAGPIITGYTRINVTPVNPSAGKAGSVLVVGTSASLYANFSLDNGPITSGAYQYNLYTDQTANAPDGPGVYLASADPTRFPEIHDKALMAVADIRALIDGGVTLQPYVPLYEAYQSALLEMTRLPSLKTRSGGRYDNGAAFSAGPAPDAVWGRAGGGFAHFDPQSSTTGYDYDMSGFDLQAGLDGLFLDSAGAALVGGITAHYRTGEAKVHSRYGDSKVHPDGYGFGGTLTWFGANGFYADAQGELTWYSSGLKAENMVFAPEDSDAFGYALSLEAGQAFGVGDGIALTPQAQLSFAAVDIDSFTGAYSDHVSFSDGQSLLARAGLAVSRESAWQDVNGEARSANIYGLANLYYEFLGKTTATVTQALEFSSEPDDFTGEIGFGGSIDWQAGKLRYSAFAEVTASTGFDTGSYGYGGNVGLKVRF